MGGGVGGWPSRGSVGGAPKPENFRKFSKKFLLKISTKMNYLGLFSKKNKNPALIFRSFGRKIQIVEKFVNIFYENSIEKLNFKKFLEKFC